MSKQRVLIELKSSKPIARASVSAEIAAASLETKPLPAMAGVELDPAFPITSVPGMKRAVGAAAAALGPEGMVPDLALEASTFVVRGEIEEKDYNKVMKTANVIGVYSDVGVQPCAVCPSGPVGTDADVERVLCASRLHSQGMDGSGVTVAIVDTGVNMDWMRSHGKNPQFDARRSWVPRAGLTPGEMPVDHGTMCAYDVSIAAPKCTLLDIALLASTRTGGSIMEGFLSDAVRAFRHLINIMEAPVRPGMNRSLVVNNSWGMFHPDWDFPVGHPGNYSDNPNHPFNRIVGTLEAAGADILFAAGNCGAECPDGRCEGLTDGGIYGANSHASVLSVAGVTVNKVRIGYSTQGPGRLTRNKPDVAGFTHFRGSEVYAADGGTSAATPVVAGLVASIRNKRPYDPGSPAASPGAIRSLLTSTAEDLGTTGYDFDHGFGVVNGCTIASRFGTPERPEIPTICKRFPWLCTRFPWLCNRVTTASELAGKVGSGEPAAAAAALPKMAAGSGAPQDASAPAAADDELVVLGYLAGVLAAKEEGGTGNDSGASY